MTWVLWGGGPGCRKLIRGREVSYKVYNGPAYTDNCRNPRDTKVTQAWNKEMLTLSPSFQGLHLSGPGWAEGKSDVSSPWQPWIEQWLTA